MREDILNKDLENLSLEVLDLFFSKIREISKNLEKEEDKIYVALSGGSSLLDFYSKLKSMARYLEKEYWDKIIFCFADERVVPLDDVSSNYFQLKRIFLNSLISENYISEEQIIKINYSLNDVALNYSSMIKKVDIALLGSGPDGHIVSLFPNHESIKDEKINFINVLNSPKPPLKRISMSSEMFLRVLVSFIFFINEGKKDALIGFNDENLDEIVFPNKLALNSKECFVVSNLNL